METLRLGEAMLRSSQPLLPFLAPPIYQIPKTRRTTMIRVSSIARQCQSHQIQIRSARAFSTSRCRRQDDTTNPAKSSNQFPSVSPSSQDTMDDSMKSLLDSALDYTKGTPVAPTSRTSRFSSPNAQARNSTSSGLSNSFSFDRPPQRSSVDDLFASLKSPQTQRKSGPSSSFDIAGMLDPKNQAVYKLQPSSHQEELPVRLGPTAGRTVLVDPQRNVDLGRALQSLETILRTNSVRRDFNQQRFHERPGLKRKRLKSLRWRKRFKAGFKALLTKVQKMKKQGW